MAKIKVWLARNNGSDFVYISKRPFKIKSGYFVGKIQSTLELSTTACLLGFFLEKGRSICLEINVKTSKIAWKEPEIHEEV